MSTYTYLVYDLLTHTKKAEIPMRGVSFGSKLNAVGSFTGTVDLADPRMRTMGVVDNTYPGKTALYVDVDGVIAWGGIVWTRRYNMKAHTLEIGGLDYLAYLEHRVISSTLTLSGDTGGFPNAIANAVLTGAFTNDISLVIPTAATTGVTASKTYSWWEFKNALQAIEDFSGGWTGGFDFAIDVNYDGSGVPVPTLNVSAPRRGRIAGSTGIVFDSHRFLDYTWGEDATLAANVAHLVGSGDGDAMLHSSGSNLSAAQAAGYPLLEDSASNKDIDNQAVLDDLAIAHARAYWLPVDNITATVDANGEPPLGSFITGDDARLLITDDRFPATTSGAPGLDAYYRIVGFTARPADHGGIDEMDVDLVRIQS